eukprot:TRINITY_DN3632_c0_g2_i11.p1 TRINITY_DN3632_c0_g2~~TRINITY_DN3632_c0_g2_i11.p1  ORF type:complete len:562 (-),score=182.30 TRINITY_DN3632_c0_g2_i11:454-2139(-)
MILLPVKETDKIDLYTPILKNIGGAAGAQFTEQAKGILQRLQTLRNNLTNLSAIRNNPLSVKKAAEDIKDYLSIWNSLSRSFTFGADKGSINIPFTWYDAYTRDRKTSSNPMAERVGMLYNLGVLYSQMGADVAKLPGNKVKEAATLFLSAAWVFERIKLDLVNLKFNELTPDVTEENLSLCSFLMKAQTQSCAYERVYASRPDRYDMLAKLSMQAAKDYEVANGYSRNVGVKKAPNGKSLLAAMQFKEGAFRCLAFYWLALDQKKKCEESVTGMGKAVASIRKATEILESLKKNEWNFPPEIMAEYKQMIGQCAETQITIERLNDKLYHDSVPSKPVEIDAMPYGKPISIEGELDRPFEGKEILSLTVPPGVKALDNEYKKEVGVIIQEAFDLIRQIEDYHMQILKKYNLPSAIHAVSNEQQIPEDMWQRINKCKENGGARGLNQMLEGVEQLSKCNETNILNIYNQLMDEEREDKELRQKYGAKWNRLPSTGLNANMLKQLEYFKGKLDTGKQSDKAIQEFVQAIKAEFKLLELDRDSLTSKIPKSSSSAGGMSPAATM